MDHTLQQRYAFWKQAVHACMREMDDVLSGQAGGGRLMNAAISMEFAWDLLRSELEEQLEDEQIASAEILDEIELYLPGRI